MATVSRLLPPRGILFDYGGTLVTENRFDPAAGAARLLALAKDAHDVTADQIESLARRLRLDIDRRRRATHLEMPALCFQRLLYELLGLTFDASPERLLLEFWEASVLTGPMPGAANALADLTAEGLPIGVVSNTAFGGTIIYDELSKHDLHRHVRFVIGSSDYGVRKPHPALFELAARKLGFDAKEIWFIGDSLPCDVAGARAAGMTAIWFNRRGMNVNRARPRPNAVLKSMSQLARLYRQSGATHVRRRRGLRARTA